LNRGKVGYSEVYEYDTSRIWTEIKIWSGKVRCSIKDEADVASIAGDVE